MGSLMELVLNTAALYRSSPAVEAVTLIWVITEQGDSFGRGSQEEACGGLEHGTGLKGFWGGQLSHQDTVKDWSNPLLTLYPFTCMSVWRMCVCGDRKSVV